jgi:hypothetical protein
MTVYTVTEPIFKEYISIYAWEDPILIGLPAINVMDRTTAGAYFGGKTLVAPTHIDPTTFVPPSHYGLFIRPISPRGWVTQDPTLIRVITAETDVEITTAASAVTGPSASHAITPTTAADGYATKFGNAATAVSPAAFSVADPLYAPAAIILFTGSATPYVEIGMFFDPLPVSVSVSTRASAAYRLPIIVPQPPEPASQTDPAQADPTQIVVRPLYGTLILPNHNPVIIGGKPT